MTAWQQRFQRIRAHGEGFPILKSPNVWQAVRDELLWQDRMRRLCGQSWWPYFVYVMRITYRVKIAFVVYRRILSWNETADTNAGMNTRGNQLYRPPGPLCLAVNASNNHKRPCPSSAKLAPRSPSATP